MASRRSAAAICIARCRAGSPAEGEEGTDEVCRDAMGMWALFAKSFRVQLTEVFAINLAEAGRLAKRAKGKYRQILSEILALERGDRF